MDKYYIPNYQKNEIPIKLSVIKENIVINYWRLEHSLKFQVSIEDINRNILEIEDANRYLDDFIYQLQEQKEEEYTKWILVHKESLDQGFREHNFIIEFRIKDIY